MQDCVNLNSRQRWKRGRPKTTSVEEDGRERKRTSWMEKLEWGTNRSGWSTELVGGIVSVKPYVPHGTTKTGEGEEYTDPGFRQAAIYTYWADKMVMALILPSKIAVNWIERDQRPKETWRHIIDREKQKEWLYKIL